MRKSLGILLIAVFVSGALGAGVVYEIEVTDHRQSPPKTEDSQMSAEGKNLKMGVSSGERGTRTGEMIYRGDRREMVVVDHDEKSYLVLDEEAIGQLAGQVGAAMAQMQEALKNVPEDQRAMVEKMMKERMPKQAAPARPVVTVRKTGERGEKAGYPCVKYEVLRGGQKIQELWVTDWSNLEGSAELQALFADMAKFFREMMDAFAAAAGDLGGMVGGVGDSMFEVFDQIDGFPVVTRDFEGGELEEESTLRSASRRTLDPAEFEPPAGYKRRSMGPQ